MSMANVSFQMMEGAGYPASTSVPVAIAWYPNATAVDGRAILLGYVSGYVTARCTTSAYAKSCIMMDTVQSTAHVNVGTITSCLWVVLS